MTARPRVVVRTDAGAGIGLGHLRRCVALAKALRAAAADVCFLVSAPDGALADIGFEMRAVVSARDLADTLALARASGARTVVVDSYALDTAYLQALAEAGCRVIAIDDPGERQLPVDLVVNPSARPGRPRYRGAAHTRLLLGPRYAMLQPEFAERVDRRPGDPVRRVLLTVGGGDPAGFTAGLVRAGALALDGVRLDVVVGPWFAGVAELRALAGGSGGAIVVHEQPRDMRALMLAAGLAISGGGQTTFELAATGTPTVAIRLADNQTLTLETLAEAGALIQAGDAGDPALADAVAAAVERLIKDGDRRLEMSERARTAVDGQGAARVAREILALQVAA